MKRVKRVKKMQWTKSEISYWTKRKDPLKCPAIICCMEKYVKCQDKKQLPWSIALQALPLPSQLQSSTSVNLHTYSYPIMRQIHDQVQLCSLYAAQKTEFLRWGGGEAAGLTLCIHHPNWRERSVGGARGSFKISLPYDGCHLCLPPTPPRPLLMKLDCLFCSAGPLILSTRALYNSLMLIVANKSTFPPPRFLLCPQSHTRTWSVPGTPWIAAREQRRRGVMKTHSGRHAHTLTHSC